MTKKNSRKRAIERALGQHAPSKQRPPSADADDSKVHRRDARATEPFSKVHRRDACATDPSGGFSAWNGCSPLYKRVLPLVRAMLTQVAERLRAPGNPGGTGGPGPRNRPRPRSRPRCRLDPMVAFLWLLEDDLDRPGKLSIGHFIFEKGAVFYTYGCAPEPEPDAIPKERPILAVSINELINSRGKARPGEIEQAARRLTKLYERMLPLRPWATPAPAPAPGAGGESGGGAGGGGAGGGG